MMAGPQELMTAEQEYLQFLPTVKHFKLDGEKPELRSSYLLVTGPHRYPVTLNFDEESGQYWGTYFNQYYGDYRLEEKEETRRIFFDTVNATRLRRPERMLKPERAYFDFLYGEKIMYLTQDELVLENIYGQTLRFKAVD